MDPVAVPDVAKQNRPWAQVVEVGPPPGVSDEECGTASALVEPGKLGDYTTNEWRVYFQPTEHDLQLLKEGGYICFGMMSAQMVPHFASIQANRPFSGRVMGEPHRQPGFVRVPIEPFSDRDYPAESLPGVDDVHLPNEEEK